MTNFAYRPREGLVIERDELRARWTFSELSSSRWRDLRIAEFGLVTSDPLVTSAASGRRFDELPAIEQARLTAFTSAQVAGLVECLNHFEKFICESWTKSQLGRTWVVPALDPERYVRGARAVPYLRMLAAPLAVSADGTVEGTHPRVAADSVPLKGEIHEPEPLTVVPISKPPSGHEYMLIDGTTRSILFMRGEDPHAETLVWKPSSGNALALNELP